MRGGEAKGGAGQAASGRAPVTKGAPSPKLEAEPCSVPLALLLPHSGKKLDMLIKKKKSASWDFGGDPVVKTSPSNAGITGLIMDQGGKILHASQPRSQKTKSTVTNSTKIF